MHRAQGKAGPNFVAGAFGTGEGFVEEEFLGGEAGAERSAGLVDGLLERGEGPGSGAAFRTGEGDVRAVRARFRDEAAIQHGGGYKLLEGEQLGSERDAGPKDAGALEEAEAVDADGNARGADGLEILEDARGLLFVDLTEELQGDMPAFGGGPAQGRTRGDRTGG